MLNIFLTLIAVGVVGVTCFWAGHKLRLCEEDEQRNERFERWKLEWQKEAIRRGFAHWDVNVNGQVAFLWIDRKDTHAP